MITELKIYSFDASGFVTQSYDVDLFESISIPVTKSIVDIKEPDQRKSDFTKTITIPGTANNNQLFSSIFNLDRATINSTRYNYQPDFNPNLKVEAILFRNSIPQIQGYMQLTGIRINDGAIEYDCVIIGKFANMFQDLGDLKLSDLDLSEFDHEWNLTNVENSWDTSIIKNGTTYVNFSSGNPNGVGYVYPLIDRGNSLQNDELVYELTTMYPSLYVKQVVDSIFTQAGYRYTSNFFNSQRFKNLIVPFCGGSYRMSENEVNDRSFLMGISSTTYSNSGSGRQLFKVGFNSNLNDTDPVGVSTTNHWWVCPSGLQGNYLFSSNLDLSVTSSSSTTLYIEASIIRETSGGVKTAISAPTNIILSTGNSNSLILETTDYVNISVGDKVYVELLFITYTGSPATTFSVVVNSSSEFYSNPDVKYQEGTIVNLSSALSNKVKQADFLKYLIKAFNLYVEVDPIDKKKFIIEPRDDFYTNDIVDFTPYLDVSKDIQISPMGLLDFKTFEMKYLQDNDEFNSKYQDTYQEPFSTQRFNIINDFIKDTKTIEIGFSASPLAYYRPVHDRIYTKIRNTDPPKQDADLPIFNIRMLQYGGLVTTKRGWYINDSSGQTMYGSFPYCGMLDDVYAPTFSLEVTTAKAYFYGSKPAITTANLYNSYWLKTINEITDKDSKLVTAYFHLTPLQMSNLSFRKYYKIDNQYYRLNKVDYDLNSNEPIKIEFLKLKVAPAFVSESTTTNGGQATFIPELPGLPEFDLPMLMRTDNTKLFRDTTLIQNDVELTTDTNVFVDYSQKIWLINVQSTVYLPDARQIKLKTGYPFIILHNAYNRDINIYSINSSQLISGSSSFTLKARHTAWFVQNQGNWDIILNNNTAG